jgi:glycerol-3-phosphate acyltransferase PlsY
VLGWKAGLPVLILDIGKGLSATYIPYLYSPLGSDPDMLLWARILCGTAAALGHIYPAFAEFRGGKAVATFFGILIGLMPVPAAGILIVFIVTVLLFRMISLGSMMAGFSLPFLAHFLTEASLPLMILSVATCLVVIATHRNNISRLLQGKEPRFSLRGKSGNK